MYRFVSLLVLIGLGAWCPVQAQHHEHHAPPAPGSHGGMPSTVVPGLAMTTDGSGTSWLPAASPMHALHTQAGAWTLMLHGSAFLRYNAQDVFKAGTRGHSQVDVPNWFMGMARRPVSNTSHLALRAMLSLDPVTVGGDGYPLLFQTGETYEGRPLIDRQHPHDLFTEMSLIYGQALGEQASLFAYLGLPGEPALGPTAFMHRPAAQHNPDAPLGHHWQDATHIVFGVATVGFRYGIAKLDGSLFTGREPDEDRYGFDRPRFDSYSLRLSANPTERLALQVSRGYLKRPEVLEPDVDKVRTTASVLYSTPVGARTLWSSTLAWGVNEGKDDYGAEDPGHGTQHSLLAESDLQLGRQAYYGRIEWVQKSPGELGLADDHADAHYDVGALTLGTARDVALLGGLQLTLGAQAALYRVPDGLQPLYGKQPASAQVYLRLVPASMTHGSPLR